MSEDIRQYLQECAASYGIAVSDGQAEQFQWYMELLIEWNEKMNLTAITEPKAVVVKHFLDSVLGVPSESCFFYEAEAGAASAFLRAYAGTSCREYFADYFSYYVTNYDDTEKAAQMERLTLETFAFFSQMEAGGWQL